MHIMLERHAYKESCTPQSFHAASAILCRSALRFLLSRRCSLKLCSAACSRSARSSYASLLKAVLSIQTILEYFWLIGTQTCDHLALRVSQATVVFTVQLCLRPKAPLEARRAASQYPYGHYLACDTSGWYGTHLESEIRRAQSSANQHPAVALVMCMGWRCPEL